MRAISLWIILAINMVPCIFADCQIEFGEESKIIEELISTQGYFCSISVKILKKENVTHYCDRLALLFEVDGLLEKLRFIENTSNYKKKNNLIETYKKCLLKEGDDIGLNEVNAYLQTEYMGPIGILKRVNNSLHKLDGFKIDSNSSSKCISYYNDGQHSNPNPTNGPQCACPSPTAPISSSEGSQTSVNYLSEFASSTYTTSISFHTNRLAEDMSSNSQGLDSSPITFTDMPGDLKPLTTIVDHAFAATTVQPTAYTDFPLTNPDFPMRSTEFTKEMYKSSYISVTPSHTGTDPEQVTKGTSFSGTEGMHESVIPHTIETPSLPTNSLINEEFSTIMEPDETQETTMSEFSSQSSMGSLFENSLSVASKEPGIETTSNFVTKKRRSLVNMDAFSRAAVTTQAVSSLPTSASDPNHLLLNSLHTNIPSSGMGLSDTKTPEPVLQEKVIGDRNLGWASSYISSTKLTTKTELSMSSPVPGCQHFISDVTRNPVLNAHKSYNIPPQQLRDITNDDRQNGFSGGKQIDPYQQHSSLPTVIIVTSVMLALLFLCGLLYYRHHYRILRRRINMSCDQDLTRNPGAMIEERVPLPIIQCDIV